MNVVKTSTHQARITAIATDASGDVTISCVCTRCGQRGARVPLVPDKDAGELRLGDVLPLVVREMRA